MVEILDAIDSVLYYPILLVVMAAAGLYFSLRMGFVQIHRLPEGMRLVMAKPTDEKGTSPFQALMVSSAACVGTGNIIGISTAICLGGPGAVFWMTVMALIGAASSFVECTLAQIYKRKNSDGTSYGGPAYYIEDALHNKTLATAFVVFLLLTYSFGFNLVCSYNVQSTFSVYSFYDPSVTPAIIGAILAILCGACVMGGAKRIEKAASILVPFMGVAYVIVTAIVLVMNLGMIPYVISMILEDAFNFKAILSGVAGSCLVMGIKRGLYSNEAGVGSAPNAAAAADVSHPVKQGLVQMLSVFIDTILVCTATAMMCLCTGIEPSESLKGAPFVQASLEQTFGAAGPYFITIALLLFAFTTLLGNLFYCEGCLNYIAGRTISHRQLNVFHAFACVVVFIGAQMKFGLVWDIADVLMGIMALINLPVILRLGGTAMRALSDYMKQRREGRNPVFKAKNIALKEKTDYWN